MTLKVFARRIAMSGFALVAALSLAHAQPATEYKPDVGQEGKDVVWVPTNQLLVNKMLDLAKVTSKDYVIDLGSGDGRTVITAAKRGARALGVEFNPDMVQLATRNAAKEGVAGKAKFVQGDIFETDFSKANVVTLFLLPQINLKLRPKILMMKPGTRIVSNTFDMSEWSPEEKFTITDNCMSHCTALFWIVPANVQGTWKMPRGTLVLEQKFQMLSGTLKTGKTDTAISDGKMTGDKSAFSVGEARYTGSVSGNRIVGIVKAGKSEKKWRAARSG
jgi:SAM-dependent methyltransferase